MMHFMLLFSRQGKLRLQKWFVAHPDKQKKKITRDLVTNILARKPKLCSFLDWKDMKIVYKRYNHTIFKQYDNLYFLTDMQVFIFVVQLNKVIMN